MVPDSKTEDYKRTRVGQMSRLGSESNFLVWGETGGNEDVYGKETKGAGSCLRGPDLSGGSTNGGCELILDCYRFRC